MVKIVPHKMPRGPLAPASVHLQFPIDPGSLVEIDTAARLMGCGRAEFVRAAALAVAAQIQREAA